MDIALTDTIAITSVIVCEDVRPEINNKFSALGIFSGDILLTEIPGSLRVALYCEGKTTADYKGPMHIRALYNGNQMAVLNGGYDAKPGPISIPLPSITMKLAEEGVLQFQASVDSTKWIELVSKKVSRQKSS